MGPHVGFCRDDIYIAPSGVQKERIEPEHMFVGDIRGKDLALPAARLGLKKSQCTPLFMEAYVRRGAGAVIHTHSQHAVMVTLLYGDEFRITHQGTALYCTALYCTALHCTVLYCTVLYCTALYCTARHGTARHWMRCGSVQCSAVRLTCVTCVPRVTGCC
jgi:hypothetical protein